jgi:hypothetical protein
MGKRILFPIEKRQDSRLAFATSIMLNILTSREIKKGRERVSNP